MLPFLKYSITICGLIMSFAGNCFGQDRFLPNQEVIHTVVKGQTLYSIARGYQVIVADLAEYNENVTADGAISPAQIIKVPILAEKNEALELVLSKLKKTPKTHKVLAKETVFGLSKQYGISVDDLKAWNKIEDNNIGIDQDLVVGWMFETTNSAAVIAPTVKPGTSVKPMVEKKPNRSVNKQDMLYQKYLADKEGKSMQSQKGAANWFETENRMMASNYYGMLSGVTVGSIVEVINPQNNKKVYVKIIGSLPNTAENTGAMIKLTPVAQTALGASDAKLQVTVNFYK